MCYLIFPLIELSVYFRTIVPKIFGLAESVFEWIYRTEVFKLYSLMFYKLLTVFRCMDMGQRTWGWYWSKQLCIVFVIKLYFEKITTILNLFFITNKTLNIVKTWAYVKCFQYSLNQRISLTIGFFICVTNKNVWAFCNMKLLVVLFCILS